MPSPDAILATLTETARQFFALAIVWHIAVALGLVAVLFARFSPSQRTATALMSIPLASVSLLAWLMESPFNGSVFALLTASALIISTRATDAPLSKTALWARMAGQCLVAFAWAYPHFLEDRSPLAYLYAAPMGLIPCPTLALIIGLTLLGGGLAGRTWISVLGVASTFYALFGSLRLGVTSDFVLLAGVIALVAQQLRPHKAPTLASEQPGT